MDHIIDFENGKVIDIGNYRTCKTLESWHTAIRQYAMLVSKKCHR